MPSLRAKSAGRNPACRLLAATLALTTAAAAQSTATPPQNNAPSAVPPGATVLHAGTQLVVVDVVVQDRNGMPVHGLNRADFHVTESKAPQQIRQFEEFSTPTPGTAPPSMPKLPPGTFTDYSPVADGGPLNILLLDALNTPMKDQGYVRYQLQQYVKHARPGTRIAIFGLTTHLILLQGFTGDPEVLKNAVEHKLIPRSSVLLDDPTGSNNDPQNLSDTLDDMGPAMAQEAANMRQFEAESQSFQTSLRVRYTLDAFHNLGLYLSSFPGRKNLMWFSGSFPLNIMPDATLTDPFAAVEDFSDEFADTTNLLTHAQVAVYPIDARGLMTNPVMDASRSGSGYARNPTKFATDTMKFEASQANEHITMDQMAADTGGHAFYNTNGLADAVAKAIDSGSHYYTLTYSPTNRKWDGNYRSIRVELSPEAAARGVKLTYRQGYYAVDPNGSRRSHEAAATAEPVDDSHAAKAYAQSAMDRGAPQPADILFKVRVLPASLTTEPKILPDNDPGPIGGLTGPFRRYDVDMVTLGNYFTLAAQPDGRWTGEIAFTVLVYDSDGKLLNTVGRSIGLNMKADTYKNFIHQPLGMHLEISVPVRSEAYLRIGLEDVPANRFGVVEIPVASVAHLPPPVYQTVPPPAPAATPAQPTPAQPAPSSPR
jgi:VWFA-related protein